MSYCHGSSRKQNWICYKKYSLRLAEHWSGSTFNLKWSVASGKSRWCHSFIKAHRTQGNIICWGRHQCLLANVQACDSLLTTWHRSIVLSATQTTQLVSTLKTVCSGWENRASEANGSILKITELYKQDYHLYPYSLPVIWLHSPTAPWPWVHPHWTQISSGASVHFMFVWSKFFHFSFPSPSPPNAELLSIIFPSVLLL